MKTTPITMADIDQRLQALDGERAALQLLRRFIRPGKPAAVLEIPVGLPMAEIERLSILSMLEHCDGNKTLAAERLGISRRTIQTKLEYYASGRCLGQSCAAVRGEGEAWPCPSLCPRCVPLPRRREPAEVEDPAAQVSP